MAHFDKLLNKIYKNYGFRNHWICCSRNL